MSLQSTTFIASRVSSATPGAPVTADFGYKVWGCYYNGADVGSRVAVTVPIGGGSVPTTAPSTPGTYTWRGYDAQTSGNVVIESSPIAVVAAAPGTETITLNNPSSQAAGASFNVTGTIANPPGSPVLQALLGGSALSGTATLSGGNTAFSFLVQGQSAGTVALQIRDTATGAVSNTINVPIAAVQVAETGSFGNLPSSATAGVAVTGITYAATNVATPYYTTQLGSGAESGRAALSGGTVPSFMPGAAGMLTLRMYDAASGGNLVTSTSFTVAAAQQQAMTGSLSGVPTSGSATVPLTGGTYSLQNGTSAYVGLYNVASGAYEGNLVALSGASGNLPSFTPAAQATYAYKLASDNAGASVLFTSPNITVGAAPNVVLTGLPSSIAAGQPLSGVTFAINNGAYGDFVLYDQTAGSQETTILIASTVMPDNTLSFLVPQIAGHSYVVQLVTTGQNPTVQWQSGSFSVTAAPGALPAQVSGFSTSNATTTQVTLNWSAVSGATGYQILARAVSGQRYGTLANTVVSGTSYTFTGLAANETFFPIVTAINANGRGPSSSALVSTASS